MKHSYLRNIYWLMLSSAPHPSKNPHTPPCIEVEAGSGTGLTRVQHLRIYTWKALHLYNLMTQFPSRQN